MVAIISLLVSFFLVSLKQHRDSARDAVIKTLMSQIMNVAEIYHDDYHTYAGVCDTDEILSDIGNFGFIETSINNNGGFTMCAVALRFRSPFIFKQRKLLVY